MWDGFPENPKKSGWHLVCRKEVLFCGIESYDEVWFWTYSEVSPIFGFSNDDEFRDGYWMRRENGSKHVYKPKDFAWNWDYVAPLKYDFKNELTNF